MSNFYSQIKNKNTVVFEAVKTKYFLSKAINFVRKMGYAYVPFNYRGCENIIFAC